MVERFEDPVFLLLGHTDALVADPQHKPLVGNIRGEDDAAVVERKLDGVGEQVAHHLVQIVGNDVHGQGGLRRAVVDGDAFARSQFLKTLTSHADEAHDVAVPPLGGRGDGRLELGYVEYLVDEQQQTVTLSDDDRSLVMDGFLQLAGGFRAGEVGLGQLFPDALDDGEGRAELVGDVGEEVVTRHTQLL